MKKYLLVTKMGIDEKDDMRMADIVEKALKDARIQYSRIGTRQFHIYENEYVMKLFCDSDPLISYYNEAC